MLEVANQAPGLLLINSAPGAMLSPKLNTLEESVEQSGVEALTANLLSDLISVMSSSYPRVTLPGSTLHCPAIPVLSLTEILCSVQCSQTTFTEKL